MIVFPTGRSCYNTCTRSIRKDKLEKEYKLHAVGDVVAKQRVKHECSIQANRYKIISNRRAFDLDSLNCNDTDGKAEEKATSSKVFCLYDVISDGSSTESKKVCVNFALVVISNINNWIC